jgi:hypothetical protein
VIPMGMADEDVAAQGRTFVGRQRLSQPVDAGAAVDNHERAAVCSHLNT